MPVIEIEKLRVNRALLLAMLEDRGMQTSLLGRYRLQHLHGESLVACALTVSR